MRTTSSFEIFPNNASERDLAKARWFRQEGKYREAEHVYRKIMTRQPGLRTGWTECFDLLRQSGQAEQALTLANDAERVFASEAFPIALKGAALIEQQRFPEALEALEVAVERDPDLALTWHELGYAAHRIGDGSRALLALDRAFALEPHTETLTLRGRILRESGEFYAATVAFEAAMHSASHEGQRAEIEQEVLVTQRLGDFAPRRPGELTTAERWFAEHGAVVLASVEDGAAPANSDIVGAFVSLAADRDWRFGHVAGVAKDEGAATVAAELGLALVTLEEIDETRVPLLVAERPPPGDAWDSAAQRVDEAGLVFILRQAVLEPPHGAVVGALDGPDGPLALGIDPANAIVMAQHPGANLADQRLTRPVLADEPVQAEGP